MNYPMFINAMGIMNPNPENLLISIISDIRQFWQRNAWFTFNDIRDIFEAMDNGGHTDITLSNDVNLNTIEDNFEAIGVNWQLMRYRHFRRSESILYEKIGTTWELIEGRIIHKISYYINLEISN